MAPPASPGVVSCSSAEEALSSPLEELVSSREELSSSLAELSSAAGEALSSWGAWPVASGGASPSGSSGGLPMPSWPMPPWGKSGAWPALSWVAVTVAADRTVSSAVSWDGPMSHSKERWPPPPLFMVPMAEMSTEEASTRLELSSLCPSSVEGMVPSSWPWTLWARSRQKSSKASTPAWNSSVVQNLVGSFST